MRAVGGAFAVLVAGCLAAPPSSVGGGDPDAAPGQDARVSDAACPSSVGFPSFSDDFSTGDLAWAIDTPGRSGPGDIEVVVASERLVFKPGAAADDHAWLQTAQFEFTAARVTAQIVSLTTDDSSQPYLGIIGPAAEESMFRYDGADLSSPSVSLGYDDAAHRWWQVRSEGGLLHFETSTDGITWATLESASPGFSLDQVRFEVGLNVNSAGKTERGDFALDDLNLPPACAE